MHGVKTFRFRYNDDIANEDEETDFEGNYSDSESRGSSFPQRQDLGGGPGAYTAGSANPCRSSITESRRASEAARG